MFVQLADNLLQFPWFATELYTLHERNKVFETLCAMTKKLADVLNGSVPILGLDILLLGELVRAGLHCPAFSPRMKWHLAIVANDRVAQAAMSAGFHRDFPFESLTLPTRGDPTTLFVSVPPLISLSNLFDISLT